MPEAYASDRQCNGTGHFLKDTDVALGDGVHFPHDSAWALKVSVLLLRRLAEVFDSLLEPTPLTQPC